MKTSPLRLLILIHCLTGPARAGLVDPRGLWQFDGNFGSPSLVTSTLTAGTDYSFATDPAGYHFLQTQVWAPAKRLTALNFFGNNGGGTPTRTNQWTMMMDVKFDALQPYASVLQTDPSNATDAPFFLSSSNNLTGTLELLGSGFLSTAGAIPVNTWVRLAITCGNDGAGGGLTLKCYINGEASGTPIPAAFNGAAALHSSFHLFTDENSEMKPTKLSSLAFWGDTLNENDIRSFKGPQSSGIRPYVSWINFAGLPDGPGYADGTGSSAHFNSPFGVAVDAAGNSYVTDAGNSVIRKITPSGATTTVAGSPGNAGAVNGLGEIARFQEPAGIAVDSTGILYVADSGNHAIRRITPGGHVTTLAGRLGIAGNVDGDFRSAKFSEPKGVALDGSGNLLVADYGNSAIRRVVLATGAVSTLTAGASSYSEPQGVAVDGDGNIYVANTDVGNLIKINPAGVVSILAQAPLLQSRSYGIAVDGGGNVYVTSYNSSEISRVTPSGTVSIVAGSLTLEGNSDGQGTAARFRAPTGLAFDNSGNLIIADTLNHIIRRMNPLREVTTLAGSLDNSGSADGVGSSSRLANPSGVATDSAGNVYVADSGNSTIRKSTPGGVVSTLAGVAGAEGSTDGAGNAALFNGPGGVAVDASRNVYVADSYNHTIRKISPSGNVSTFAGTARNWGNANGQGSAARFDFPSGIAVDNAGTVYVADFDGRRIRTITPSGLVGFFAGFPGDASHAVEATRFTTAGIAVDGIGNVYRVIVNKHHVEKISPSGTITTHAGDAATFGHVDGPRATARFNLPTDVAVDEAGNLYITEGANHTIRKISAAGMVSTLGGSPTLAGIDSGLGRLATFNFPNAIAIDGAGIIYVSDARNHRICRGSPGTGSQSLTEWRQRHFGLMTDSGNAANSLDFDRDGAANLMEYAMGTDPTARSSMPPVPAGEIVGGNFQTTFIPPAGLTAISYQVEQSSSLLPGRWFPITRQLRQDTSRYGIPIGNPPDKGFLRIRINELPVTNSLYQSITP